MAGVVAAKAAIVAIGKDRFESMVIHDKEVPRCIITQSSVSLLAYVVDPGKTDRGSNDHIPSYLFPLFRSGHAFLSLCLFYF
jgi:hypothetical protein